MTEQMTILLPLLLKMDDSTEIESLKRNIRNKNVARKVSKHSDSV